MFNIYKTIFKNPFTSKYFVKCLNKNFTSTFKNVRQATFYSFKNQKPFYLCTQNKSTFNILLSSSLFTWLGLSKSDEKKESQLITTIKRSILLIQRGELVKAEQMLHIALRLAEDQNNSDGITYVYDLLANLALERSQIDKAEKLFVNVLQRILVAGLAQDDIKVIHISLKLARIYQIKKDYEKAEIGFTWCLDSIKRHLETNNTDAILLHGVIQDWYAKYLLQMGKYKECLSHLEKAYNICSEIEGLNSEKAILLLNDLGTVNSESGNYDRAIEYLNQALILGKKIDDFDHLGVIYANLGLVKIKQGVLPEAKQYCKEGWRLGKKQNNNDAIDQANYCFEQLKNCM